ncbi:VOC family protein [Lutibaculum baratangense]|uniref:Glyoxalase-like domain-containing protein n=1 Tax=Lutibaculum baratangense AMV1 TaxID=631454 RepID=V4RDQ1_9HYPH|nr:VOC family protein [Lutibaculum baratangense]ESR23499.1 hypothetical protein N177_3567 [Lutibaculum baratangense AMV1]
MARGIDHLVIAVRDLERVRELYAAMGFTLTPVAQHPFGTANSLVQLQGSFLELLTLADAAAIPVPEPGAFSFPRFNQRFLDRREGIAMLVLETHDAVGDGQTFAKAGLQSYLPFEFGRDATMPDGTKLRVGFKLAFASDPLAPEAGFFTCQQLKPEAFWKPEYQRHDNTAVSVVETLIVSPQPADHRDFLLGFTGCDAVREVDGGLLFETPRGAVRVVSPATMRAAWGEAIDGSAFDRARIAGTVIGVADLRAAGRRLQGAGMTFAERGGRLVVGARDVMGTAIAFEEVRA